ncbi:MAG: FlgD immunoglobulin-like domain containing protein [bacterium]
MSYTVPEGATTRVQIKIYDLQGRLTRTLVNEDKQPGRYVVRWDGRDDRGTVVSSGHYFYHIRAGDFTSSRKMIILR